MRPKPDGCLSMPPGQSLGISPHKEELLDPEASSQSRRPGEQRASGSGFPGLRINQQNGQSVLSHLMANADNAEPDDDFFDMLVKCQVRFGAYLGF